ncbi:V-set and immunoglobulin domain-containing protein 1-like [Aplochiton taeniatus]
MTYKAYLELGDEISIEDQVSNKSCCVQLISVRIPQKFVNVTLSGNVSLQCLFTTIQSTSGLNIQWSFLPKNTMTPQTMYYYQAGNDFISKPYQGRLTAPSSPATTRNAMITISNMQPSDTGSYICEVHNMPDVEGNTEGTVFVNVLQKPSMPFCAVHGDVESGHLVTLTCHSEKGNPPPIYTWTRLDQTKTQRLPVLGRGTLTGLMEIRNLSQFEFGEYQCNSTNDLGFLTCSVELNHELGDGVIAGAVIGALLGCVLILLVVWFIAHTLKKHKYSAVKASQGAEMKTMPQGSASVSYEGVPSRGSTHHANVTSGGVPMTTPHSQLHADAEEEVA